MGAYGRGDRCAWILSPCWPPALVQQGLGLGVKNKDLWGTYTSVYTPGLVGPALVAFLTCLLCLGILLSALWPLSHQEPPA
jgi:hypothetical protein